MSTKSEALKAGVDPEEAQQIVNCMTWFATIMCVVFAVAKLTLWISINMAIVKTSTLDSLGDLVASIVSLYTGIKMNQDDPINFPVGQAMMEPIGVLTFSTLMAAMMFQNALGNIEELLEEQETSNEEAIGRFVDGVFGVHEFDSDEHTHQWTDVTSGYDKFKRAVVRRKNADQNTPPIMQSILNAESFEKVNEDEEILNHIERAADIENEALAAGKLWFTVYFLLFCTAYKIGLWIWLVCISIPKTGGSSILQALADDQQNDSLSTIFCIVAMILAKYYEAELGDWADKIDPLSSLVLSLYITYCWVCTAMEQITFLSSKTAPTEAQEPFQQAIEGVVHGTNLKVDKVSCYQFGAQYTVEASLIVTKPDKTDFATVAEVVGQTKSAVSKMEDVERVIVTTKRAAGGA